MVFMVNEIFLSIQGEGPYQGRPTVFVRFGGCNLRCSWCDTAYAFREAEEMKLREVLGRVDDHAVKDVCLTGGEPLLQEDLPALTRRLLNEELRVTLETNGSIPIKEYLDRIFEKKPDATERRNRLILSLDVKAPSSDEEGTFYPGNLAVLEPWDYLKFVVCDKGDMLYAKDFLTKRKVECPVIVQPVFGRDPEELVGIFLGTDWPSGQDVRFGLQIHKTIWGPDARGV